MGSIDVGGEDAFAQVVEHQHPERPAQAAEGALIQFSPHLGARAPRCGRTDLREQPSVRTNSRVRRYLPVSGSRTSGNLGHDVWRNRVLVPLSSRNEVRIVRLAFSRSSRLLLLPDDYIGTAAAWGAHPCIRGATPERPAPAGGRSTAEFDQFDFIGPPGAKGTHIEIVIDGHSIQDQGGRASAPASRRGSFLGNVAEPPVP